MQKFFAVAAILLSMTSAVFAAPVAVAKGIQPTGINNYGDDGQPSTVDTRTGQIVPYNPKIVSAQPATA